MIFYIPLIRHITDEIYSDYFGPDFLSKEERLTGELDLDRLNCSSCSWYAKITADTSMVV